MAVSYIDTGLTYTDTVTVSTDYNTLNSSANGSIRSPWQINFTVEDTFNTFLGAGEVQYPFQPYNFSLTASHVNGTTADVTGSATASYGATTGVLFFSECPPSVASCYDFFPANGTVVPKYVSEPGLFVLEASWTDPLGRTHSADNRFAIVNNPLANLTVGLDTRTVGGQTGIYTNASVPVRANITFKSGVNASSENNFVVKTADSAAALTYDAETNASTYPSLNESALSSASRLDPVYQGNTSGTIALAGTYDPYPFDGISTTRSVTAFDPIEELTTTVETGTPLTSGQLLVNGDKTHNLTTTVTYETGSQQTLALGTNAYTVTSPTPPSAYASLESGADGGVGVDPEQSTNNSSTNIVINASYAPPGADTTATAFEPRTSTGGAPALRVTHSDTSPSLTAPAVLNQTETAPLDATTTLVAAEQTVGGDSVPVESVLDGPVAGALSVNDTSVAEITTSNGEPALVGKASGTVTVTLTLSPAETEYLATTAAGGKGTITETATVPVAAVESVQAAVSTRTLGNLTGVYANETAPVEAVLTFYNGTTRTVPVAGTPRLSASFEGGERTNDSLDSGTFDPAYSPARNDDVTIGVTYDTTTGQLQDETTVDVFDPFQGVTTSIKRTSTSGLTGTPFNRNHLLATGDQSYPIETNVTLAGGAGTRSLADVVTGPGSVYSVGGTGTATVENSSPPGKAVLEPTAASFPGFPLELTASVRPGNVSASAGGSNSHTATATATVREVTLTNATVSIAADEIFLSETTTVNVTTTLEQTAAGSFLSNATVTGTATQFTTQATTSAAVLTGSGPLALDTTPLANGSYTLTGTGNGNGTVTLTIEASQTPYLETGNVTASDTVGVGLPKYDKQPVLLGIPGVPRSGEVLNRQYGIKDGEFKLFSGSEEPMQLYLVYPRDADYNSDAAFKQRFAAAVSSATGLPTFEEVKQDGSRNISNQAWHGGQFERLYTEHHGIEGPKFGYTPPFNRSIQKGYAVRLSGANSPVSINDADTDTLFNVIPGTGVQLPQSPNINIPIGIRPGPDTRIGTGNDYTVEIRDSKTTNESVPFQKTTGDPLGVTPPGENVTGQTPIGTVSADTVGIATVRVSATGTTYNNIRGVNGSFEEESDLLAGLGTVFTVLLGPNGNGPNVRTDDGPTIGITEGDEIEINTYDNVGAAAKFDDGEQLSCVGIKNRGGCDDVILNDDTAVRQPFQGIDFATGAGADRTDLAITGKSDWRDDRGGTINRSTSDPGLGTVVLGTQTMKKNGNSLTSGETLTIERGTATTNPWGLEISHDTRPKDGQRELVTGFNGDNWKLVVEGTDDEAGGQPN